MNAIDIIERSQMQKLEIIRNMLNRHRGKFFFVEFRKKDGSIRKMNGRQGVKNGTTPLKGGNWSNSGAKPNDYDIALVTDIDKEKQGKPSRRSFKLDSVVYLKIGGEIYSAGEK